MMTDKLACSKCGYSRFSYYYRAARRRFLWWRAKPECMVVWCLGCGYQDERADLVGKIKANG